MEDVASETRGASGTATDGMTAALIEWTQDGSARSARWQSEGATPPPREIVVADDRMPAHEAVRLAAKGIGLLWQGDYFNARHLLDAMARRLERRESRRTHARPGRGDPAAAAFAAHRAVQAERARILSKLLLRFEAGHTLALRRAPDVRSACEEAFGAAETAYVMPLRELLGAIGAHEWRKKGIAIAAIADRIHPHYGVFSPIRTEYVDLVASAPLDEAWRTAFDIGTGTGVLAAVLARRGVTRVIATDSDPRAVECAQSNVERLGLAGRIEVIGCEFFPEGRADLIVCNPPWLPGMPSAPIERAIFDPGSAMLVGFLHGLAAHLAARGEGWLVLSDFAERIGLRTREWLEARIAAAGLQVAGRHDAQPRHRKAADRDDPLHNVRAAEIVSLWRLRPAAADTASTAAT